MLKNYLLSFSVWLLFTNLVLAQTPFTATWNFEGNSNGNSSSGLVNASPATYTGVNLLAVNQYTTGFAGLGANVQNWSTSLCNQTEYVQFSVQPAGSATITLTTLSFAFANSTQGPQQISVWSSVDGFGSDIYSSGVAANYQTATISLSNPGFINQSGSITFRIYACNPMASGGTLKLDEIQINAIALPVTLLSFTAKPEGDRVLLAWATSTERDAHRFVVERSRDLGEYVTVGEVAANGTTNERQYYGLTDLNPEPGINYYRLKQIDFAGATHEFKPVSVIIQAQEPIVAVYPNPASPDRIHLRLWNADDATVRLLTITGQPINCQVERQPGQADLLIEHPLPAGLYWLAVQINGKKRVISLLIR
ncbi:T9SS type A sorting domain-containing protein [Spirosoma areae]